MLSASAYKFNEPRGVGFLYIRDGVKLCPFMDGGAQETKMRAGTENTAAIVGMTAALRKNNDILDQNTTHVMALEKLFLSEMDKAGINYVRNGCNTLPGLLSLSFPGHSGEISCIVWT